MGEIQKISWKTIEEEKLSDHVSRQTVFGEKGMLARFILKRGEWAARHSHDNEEYLLVISGAQKYIFDDREIVVNAGEAIVIPRTPPIRSSHWRMPCASISSLPFGKTGLGERISIFANRESRITSPQP